MSTEGNSREEIGKNISNDYKRTFFNDYKRTVFDIRESLINQRIERKSAHDFTLQFLNRIMFIYFISKKGWLNNNLKFFRWFWQKYRHEKKKSSLKDGTFYEIWLKTIFFKAFNNKFDENNEFSDEINKVLRNTPYLNIQFFKENDLDSLGITIPDDLISRIMIFFEKYNFTMKEDRPLETEVAVDPEMIGYVYESLANVALEVYSPEDDLRKTWGIFYTPKIEVDFMVRGAIVQYLIKRFAEVSREKIIEFVFGEKDTPYFNDNVISYFDAKNLWPDLEYVLDNISVVDPACGSGAFLIGTLNVLTELKKVTFLHLHRSISDFRIKKRIIAKSLYGVDIMPWAIQSAELRLWLQLIVESDSTLEDLRSTPLLPNLDMNLRIGDIFVQNVNFADVMEEKGGFDLVIGNPPYIRQEKIAPPDLLPENITLEIKQDYKNKLNKLIQTQFAMIKKFDKKSDYYLYFYFIGLSLLNSNGILCFITSNSWLDVNFGKVLQEFLIQYVPILAIFDNQVRRSFSHADVNTVIIFLGAPIHLLSSEEQVNAKEALLENKAKFITLRKPFEDIINARNIIEFEKANKNISTALYRIYPISQKNLFSEGSNDVDREDQLNTGKYTGNKWGARYLRIPDILLKIFLKKRKRLIPFKEPTINYKYGIKTGKVKFFYLDEETIEKFRIEKEFIYPIETTSQKLNTLFIEETEKLFYCNISREELKNTGALEYIQWGEENGMNKGPSVESHRPYWYSLEVEDIDCLIFRFWNKRFWTPLAQNQLACSDNFFYGKFRSNEYIGKAQINSTFYFLQIETFGRVNQGEGVLNTYGPDFPYIHLVDFDLLDEELLKLALLKLSKREVKDIFKECGINPAADINKQIPKPLSDRKELDDIIFDALELTQEERQEIYRSICLLVQRRLNKANSLKI